MPSPTYSKLLEVVTPYVDRTTAVDTIGRHIGTATPESFSEADLRAAARKLSIALKLYVADRRAREELLGKIEVLSRCKLT